MSKVKERGLFVMIFKDFIRSITPKFPKHTLVGVDYFGTKYYEIERTESAHKKPNRYFVPKEKDNFEQEMPAEWEAWLRHRRRVAPTEEEVSANYQMILTKRENAAKLEEKYASETEVLEIVDPNVKPLNQHASIGFPAYDEYKQFGQNYKPKIKKEH
ncbi:NADH dehydrogenase [ubiquinone] 1 alpha subcomplex assembly factor 2 isoform X2 [Copidosoma floridanum]|nr:NADH dehydrogenase [ubiquinone] 1 alpha subcomplex assembly factor 2 isoform X2 [Copidosoma floridanum]